MDQERSKKNQHPSGHVIPFRRDAAFFFERAAYYMDRHDLMKAMKYFRRACEYEPNNPVHHFNLAGVLSELGRYEESNEILEHVIEEIDREMTDCYFYMANNYAYMGLYEKAEEYAARYLELNPQGDFSRDAEEMLEILVSEFGGGEVLRRRLKEMEIKLPESVHAVRLIHEGKFREAAELLKKLIRENPDGIALQNNLSIAYYYLGKMDLAISVVEDILQKDPCNIHALCNLAVYLQYKGHQERVKTIVSRLSKVYPLAFDQGFKLATTLGILGHHEQAYRLFMLLFRFSERLDPLLLHCVAAAAYNSGKYTRARRMWKDLTKLDPNNHVAPFYLKQMELAEQGYSNPLPVPYQYQLPFYEQFKIMEEQLQEGTLLEWKKNPLVRSYLLWALKHGNAEIKTMVIQVYALIADQEVENALREFIQAPDESDQLKEMAAYVLRQMGAEVADDVVSDGRTAVAISLPHLQEEMFARRKEWKDVWLDVEKRLSPYGNKVLLKARNVWLSYLEKTMQQPPRIVKVQSWSAGIAYIALNQMNMGISQGDIATLFGVSSATVSKISRRIVRILEEHPEGSV
ncbi:hypothetical protein DNHGIG_08400 [Collibacillus ludicampi]|uniref:Tetratricopeptide repeat protein n=1 Tax=Collibacillus ludicampi TaxID=2771369 RepID=A0AAV4LBW7_9BACL|nr:tetratricopeptide repeat protein [Collibacillus ludicampi]GIM45291.1 hypothetical protein DNHGIG_08400 [Collibacillus ludicampi]